jgi:anti-sigma B factor antagonist
LPFFAQGLAKLLTALGVATQTHCSTAAIPQPWPSIYQTEGTSGMFEIRRKHIEPDVLVIQPVGRVIMGRPCQELEWLMDELVRGSIRKVILDLSEVDRVDSTGIGVIVTSSAKLRKAGGELRVSGAHGMVHDMVYTANIHRIIPFFDRLEEAAASFATQSKSG